MMKNPAAVHDDVLNRPKGIQRIRHLPDPQLGTLWDSIIVDEKLKKQLLSQAVLNFNLRPKIARTVIPLHGAILLIGPPGTGKTSLARGLAHRTAQSFKNGHFRLLEVEPHALTSSQMGRTQRAVAELFSQSIADAAAKAPTIVLLDEVETLAVDRTKLSFEANPVDVHRATDAVLAQLDELAERHPNLLFVATSNFPQAIDRAFTSRCDLVVRVPLPDHNACKRILKDCLVGLGQSYAAIGHLPSAPQFQLCAEECVGLDGRAIRKMVATALASSPETAMNPELVTIEMLVEAARAAKAIRKQEGEAT